MRGTVQGVGFRQSAQMVADQLGIVGFAMNYADGSVYIEVEGEQSYLDEFVEWCRIGPSEAQVSHLTSLPGELKEYTTFEIRRQTSY